jgi:antitoxin component of RelBE/YafQ-DinJ toxin-antitoxin module
MSVARSVHVRLDDDAVLALGIVRSSQGLTDSEAVRVALREAAARRRKSAAIRAEVAALAANPEYQRETAEIQELIEELRPDFE